MCSFIVTNLKVNDQDIESANKFSVARGPDYTNIYYDTGSLFTWLHNLLHITGEKTPQPFLSDDAIATFNGQIYNYKDFKPDASSDGYCILDVFREGTMHDLDGEFAIVYHSKKQNSSINIDSHWNALGW